MASMIQNSFMNRYDLSISTGYEGIKELEKNLAHIEVTYYF